ncbi:MAG: SMI1/KNR4 family protein [Oscillatoriales cyanobacterium CG2_30_44_21]|nr:MAG: SMI1/KNR4 family protein [Oscillatoriales cyanobacterium CG2_30_44_21]
MLGNFEELPFLIKQVFVSNKTKSCSLDEIAELEKQCGFNLPNIYRLVLLEMGHGAGDFWAGEDCFYDCLPLVQTWAKELLLEDNFPISLPDDAFVFFMHQGYQFDFFRFSEGDNPPVYSYLEGQSEIGFIKTYEKFTDFLCAEVEYFNKHSTQLLAA